MKDSLAVLLYLYLGPDLARGVHAQGRRLEPAERGDEGADGAVLPPRGRGVHVQVPQQGAPDPHGLRLHHLHQDCQQVEHRAHRVDDLLPRGGRQHPGAAGHACQVREQNSDQDQDRPQLQDA